jgi:peroxiredoxin
MGFGTPLAALAMVVVGAAMLSYVSKMRKNRAPLRPVGEQVIASAAILMATTAFWLNPGILGGLVAVVAIVPAGLFLLTLRTSGEPAQPPNMHIGQPAPDFRGVDAGGHPFRLADLRGQAVLLKFFRGAWCPHCMAELKEWASLAPEFEALGVKLVAVSSDTAADTARLSAKRHWPIDFVADPSLEAHRLYNVQHRRFAPRRGPFREMAIPTTVLIGADGKVLWYVQSRDYRVRPPADWVLGMIAPFVTPHPRRALAA